MTAAVYADDLALLTNTPAQAEFLLYSQEKTVGSIGPYVNADKIVYMCFKQKGAIFKPLKLVDPFT